MIMKKSFPLLRAIGLSAGLIASTAMMAPAQAATTGTITATGTVPATCSVTGGSITMDPSYDNSTMSGSSSFPISSTGTATTVSITAPVLTKPTGSTVENADLYGTIQAPGQLDTQISSNLTTPGLANLYGTFSGSIVFNPYISNITSNLKPGTCTLSSTLSYVTN
jgi:hypothetical protein